MERLITVLLLAVGLINFAPVVGVLSADLLASAYAIPRPDGDLLVLLRHRALLFGIIGGIVWASVFSKHLQPVAMLAAAVSMVGFIVITLGAGEFGEKLRNVMVIDVVGTALLALAAYLRYRTPHER